MPKDGFIIYKSFYEPIKGLSDKQFGRLFRALFNYQIEGSTQVDTDIQMPFAFFKNQMDIDEGKYQKVIQRNKQNGSKGGRPPKEENPKNPVGLEKPKKPDNDNDNDNDNDGKIVYKPPKFDFSKILIETYGCDRQHVLDWLKVREKKKAANTETALKKIVNECNRHNFPVSEAVKICAERSWQGFEYKWIENINNRINETDRSKTGNSRLDADKIRAAAAIGFGLAEAAKKG